MLLWEFILTADNARDLTDGARALAWLVEVGFVVPCIEAGDGQDRAPQPGCWADVHSQFFAARLLVLRSIAARLKAFRSREPQTEAWEADNMFRRYVRDYVRLRVAKKAANAGRAGAKDSSSPRPLDRRNYDGLRFDIAIPTDVEAAIATAERNGLHLARASVWRDLEQFFAAAFASMVVEGFAPICGRCGWQLAPTPTGRKPRAKFCGKCQFKAWEDGKTDEEKRERWKRDKRQQRGMSQQPNRRN